MGMMFIGLFMQGGANMFGDALVIIGAILFSTVLLFQIVTLPVEFNASTRASATNASISCWSVTHTGHPGPWTISIWAGSSRSIPLRMIEWVWPWMLLLAPLPLLVRRLVPPARGNETALRAPFYREWRRLSDSQRGRPQSGGRLPLLSMWLLWLLLLLAAARPVWIGEAIELPNSGRDLMLAVDISGSMRIEDMQLGQVTGRRIDAVQQLGAEFISRRSGDRAIQGQGSNKGSSG